MLLSSYIIRALSIASVQATTLLPVHNITRNAGPKFENLAIRSNGQILTTTAAPNASIYQVDPLGILPLTLIHTIPNVTSANGIAEGKNDVFYVATGDIEITDPSQTHPESYAITEIDMRGVSVFPNGTLSKPPKTKRAASLPGASLLNGVAFASPHSDHLVVADSFRGLIWNVNVCTGEVGMTLNNTTTKGSAATGPLFTGVNGLKVYNGTMYWTSTGRSTLYKVPIDECGRVQEGQKPEVVASELICDDFVVDHEGNAYVASPLDVLNKVSPQGKIEVVAGTFNSTRSSLVGPTAVRFGRLESDRWSLYITTDGGLQENVSSAAGISRIDLIEA